MRKGIGVSPGVVVGVAHRVESVLGSIEQQTLDSPSLVAGGDRAVRPGRGRRRRPSSRRSSRRSPRSWGPPRPTSSRATCRSSTTRRCCRRSTALIENQQLTALSALAGRDEQLRRPVRADPAGVLSRADDRHPRRDLEDRVAPDAASRSATPIRPAIRTATATATNR